MFDRLRSHLAVALGALFVAMALPAVAAAASPGSPDPSFGQGGFADLRFGGFAGGDVSGVAASGAGVAVLADPRAGSSIARVARFTAAGAPVAPFGDAGTAALPSGAVAFASTGVDLALSPSGEVTVLWQSAGSRWFVSRLTAAGRADSTFDGDGVRELPAGMRAEQLALTPDGGVAVVGTDGVQAAVLRLSAAGAPLDGFGNGGLVRLGAGEGNGIVADGAGGELLVTAALLTPADRIAQTLARLTPTGMLDAAFASGGVAEAEPDGGREWRELERGPDGSIVVLAHDVGSAGWTLLRFGESGLAVPAATSFSYDDRAADFDALAVDRQGRALVSGTDRDGRHGFVRRYTSTGAPDGEFGAEGEVDVDDGLGGLGLARAGDDIMLATSRPDSGRYDDPVVGDTVLRRISGDGLDPSFGGAGAAVVRSSGPTATPMRRAASVASVPPSPIRQARWDRWRPGRAPASSSRSAHASTGSSLVTRPA